jgi:Flp pilus assembly protein TadG
MTLTTATRKLSNWFCRCRGAAAVEFALIVPVFLILLAGMVEIGFAAYQAMQVQDAAEAGALYAAKYGWDPTGIANAVVNATGAKGLAATPAPAEFCGCPVSGGGITTVTCTSTCTGGTPPGVYISVGASLPHETILPDLNLPIPATLTGHATIRVQ